MNNFINYIIDENNEYFNFFLDLCKLNKNEIDYFKITEIYGLLGLKVKRKDNIKLRALPWYKNCINTRILD